MKGLYLGSILILGAAGAVAVPSGGDVLRLRITAASKHQDLISRAVADSSRAYGVPEKLIRAVIAQESGFKNGAVRFERHVFNRCISRSNNRGDCKNLSSSIGLMQIMGYHAKDHGMAVSELTDPRSNIELGTKILAECIRRRGGDYWKGLICYNGGKDYPPRIFNRIRKGELYAENFNPSRSAGQKNRKGGAVKGRKVSKLVPFKARSKRVG